MLKAELGDILYYIIFAVVILASLLDKMAKAKKKKQEAGNTPIPSESYDEFEDVDAQQQPTQPQSIEEVMRRMMETIETPEQQEVFRPKVVESLVTTLPRLESCSIEPLIEKEATIYNDYEFDIRQAVIASEILNRKY